jgi:uncharacterized protein with HEPN domain
MAREIRHFLHDIIEAIDNVQGATNGKSFADYQGDVILRYALERAVEIISEASRHVPDEMKATRPEIAWPRIKAIGNVLRHEYHGLSDTIIWGAIIDELPKLRIAIRAFEEQLESD